MEVNFDFVKNSSFKEAFPTAEKIHKLYTIDDYRDVISNSRLLLESLIKKIFKLENLSPYYTVHDGEHRNLRNNTHYLRNELSTITKLNQIKSKPGTVFVIYTIFLSF